MSGADIIAFRRRARCYPRPALVVVNGGSVRNRQPSMDRPQAAFRYVPFGASPSSQARGDHS